MSDAPKFNDRYIRDGFPSGWHVQDRLDDNTALLCKDAGAFSGFPANRCICVRPRAISTDEWLPTARQIATAMATTDPLADPRVKALVEAARPFADIGLSENPDYQPMIRLNRDAILILRAALAAMKGGRDG